ncbi:MAG TPA: pseudouridine synthase [Candidatus Tetragenococcus pullicola]|nr:pseudouridine synthase [Candidatus Tetragenococcus pullicola]
MRLDKLIEAQFKTSKKQTKRLFLSQQVLVDGKMITQENKNVDSDLHDIQVARKKLYTHEHYFLMNKPKGVVTAKSDPKFQTFLDLMDKEDRFEELTSAGRLDRDTEGLLFLTTNGQLVYELSQNKKKVKKMYEVQVNGALTKEDQLAFEQGIIFYDGTLCQKAHLDVLYSSSCFSKGIITITEGKRHQIKKMCLACGKKVISLKRLSIGTLTLGDLASGSYRALTTNELIELKSYFC